MKLGARLVNRVKTHPLVDVLIHLKGNPKVCVLIEPLWGIPFNLIAPFATIYMYELGVTNIQIGLISTLSMMLQLVFSFLGGTIADKYGRKRTTMVGDMLGWGVACFVWGISQNFWFFLLAALLNAFEQINQTAWTCLLIEDADKRQVVNIYTWITISGLLAVFFAPLSGVLIERFSLVPLMRVLYFIYAIAMVVKTVITYKYTTETRQGHIRMQETKHTSFWRIVGEYRFLIPKLLKNKATMQTLMVMIVLSVTSVASNNFFGLYATDRLGIPEKYLAYFPILRAVVMMVFLFFIQHRIRSIRVPMQVGFILFGLAQGILVFVPRKTTWMLVLVILMEAVAHGLVMPRKDALMTQNVDPHERARIVALLTTFMIAVSAPFGYITGFLANIDRRLVFVLTAAFYLLALLVVSLMKESAPPEEV